MDELNRLNLEFLELGRHYLSRKQSKKRSIWQRRIFQRVNQYGAYHTLFNELRLGGRENFFRYMHMSPQRFEALLQLVGPRIVKKDTRLRKAVPAGERLAITIRYLATGDSQLSQSFSFRRGRSTISKIVSETCIELWNVLSGQYLRPPSAKIDRKNIASDFEHKWNFPGCIGALDGKHICIECPQNMGSAYYNYKHFHSIVLMTMCNTNYTFTLVDIGGYGRDDDAGIFNNSLFGKAFHNKEIVLPDPIEKGEFTLPYVIMGDDIFPLKEWLIEPYPGRNLNEIQQIFNYRLSWARRVIENCFGILCARWKIFRRPIKAGMHLIQNIVKATICLHNYLRLTENAGYLPTGFVDSYDESGAFKPGEWRAVVLADTGLHFNKWLQPCQ